MSTGGWSKGRLSRMHDVMAGHVERGTLPGLVTLICRHGDVRVDTIGRRSFASPALMQRDTIFRISSMTQPVIAVATLILVEACKLRLDEPVDRLLPELAGRRVLTRLDGPIDDTVPANRPITVRDLLTFRAGFGLIVGPPDTCPIQTAMAGLGLALGPPHPALAPPPDEWMRRLGTLPLMHQPGERWLYDTASSVLGVLIARASGQPLDAFFRQYIFEPLGMRDTSFSVPAEKRIRFIPAYGEDGSVHDPVDGEWAEPPAFPSGAGGLVSTVDDYLVFGQMLLHGGKHGNQRILSRLSIEAMTTDQLTPAQKATSAFFPGFWEGRGWGFGVSIVTRRDGVASVPGRYGWDGGLGTSWATDPKEDLVAILMTQRAGFPQLSNVYLDFWTSVYQAIDD